MDIINELNIDEHKLPEEYLNDLEIFRDLKQNCKDPLEFFSQSNLFDAPYDLSLESGIY